MIKTPSISTFLWFEHEAEPAAEFYTALFPNSRITRIARWGDGVAQGRSTLGVRSCFVQRCPSWMTVGVSMHLLAQRPLPRDGCHGGGQTCKKQDLTPWPRRSGSKGHFDEASPDG